MNETDRILKALEMLANNFRDNAMSKSRNKEAEIGRLGEKAKSYESRVLSERKAFYDGEARAYENISGCIRVLTNRDN